MVEELYKSLKERRPSGFMTKADVRQATNLSKVTVELTDRLYDTLDRNDDGGVSISEFIIGISILSQASPEDKLEFAFNLFDYDQDGVISKDELHKIVDSIVTCYKTSSKDNSTLTAPTAEELTEELFAQLDNNGDGRITLDEFKAISMKNKVIASALNCFIVATF
eukprot:GEZU01022152.1.p1 GENE.GEZU01022152.1~~GEZU01022152.1.p1  ORF type:complete len:166 (+),score=46.17 GEZU01022152.1:198-695(+)